MEAPSSTFLSNKWKQRLKWGAVGFLCVSMLGIASVLGLWISVKQGQFGALPTNAELSDIRTAEASEIYFANGELMGKYYWQNRTNLRLKAMPDHLIDALVATEDARFYEHEGVDYRATMRVLFKSVLLGDRSSGGGSTISQQLAKNLYPREQHGWLSLPVSKIKEMLIASQLEEVYPKDQILELYLNTVPFGENVFGIGAASERFFSKTPQALTLEQGAVLVGMLKGNTIYNPHRYPQRAIERRNVVLAQMEQYGYLTSQGRDSLQHTILGTQYRKQSISDGPAPHFRQTLAEEIKTWLADNPKENGKPYNLYTDGLRIHTTLDPTMQRLAEEAVITHLKDLQADFDEHWENRTLWSASDPGIQRAMQQSKRYRSLKAQKKSDSQIKEIFDTPVSMTVWTWEGAQEVEMSPMDSLIHYQSFLQAGFLAMEPQTGYIRAWVGGGNFSHFKYDHITSRRQVGSTFKPIIYAAAMDQGMDPCEYIANEKRTYPEFKDWSPGNADGKYEGFYSLKGGLANSVNTVSAEVMKRVGVEKAVDFAEQFGFRDLPREASLVLGTADLSLLEMVGGYSAFANEGVRAIPIYLTRIETKDGQVLVEFPTQPQQIKVMQETTASMMTDMLQTVVRSGTGSRLRRVYGLSNEIGGKTGTTQNQTDGWFMGVTPHLVAGAWVGGEDRQVRFRSLRLGQGANTALPIYGEFMRSVYQESAYSQWKRDRFPAIPAGVLNAMDCSMYEETDPNILPVNLQDIWKNLREGWRDRKEQRQQRRELRRNPFAEPEPESRGPFQRRKPRKKRRSQYDGG
ncbi:MAG: transglycosylase domain-containing protein [Bacteroidota bacterium]